MNLIYLALAWFLGLWLAKTAALPPIPWLLAAAAALAALLLFRRHPQPRLWLACLVLLCLAAARYAASLPTIDQGHVAYYNGRPELTLTGRVVAELDLRDRSVYLRLQAETLQPAGEPERPVQGLVLVRLPRFAPVAYGQRLRLAGRLTTPESFEGFDYRAYLARQGVYSTLSWPLLTVLAERQGHPLYHAVYDLKARAHAAITALLPDPQASLLAGILLGNDNGLPPDLARDFRTTGMSHIIAISGFNVTLLVGALVRAGQPLLGRRPAIWAAMIGVALYTLLVGAGPSVVRAALMGSLYLFSRRLLGRPAFTPTSLFTAGLAMTAADPHALWDAGFQLSFAATLGLMLFAGPMSDWLRRRAGRYLAAPILGPFREALLATLAAQIFALPILVAASGRLSLVNILANLLILPTQPFVMTFGGLATLVGLVSPALAQPLAWIAWLFLAYTTTLVRLLARLPYADVASPGWLAALLAAAALFPLYLAVRRTLRPTAPLLPALPWASLSQGALLGGGALTALLVLNWGLAQPDGRLHVAFLDVGQGDAIFIQTPSGRQMVVDGGHYPSLLNDRLGRQMPFWDRSLDLVVATHPDGDHVAGLPGLFGRYHVGRLLTDGALDGPAEYDALLAAASQAQTLVHVARAGETILIGDGVRLDVLHPAGDPHPADRNENSVVLRLVYRDFSLLLTGDLGREGEQRLLDGGRPLQSLVLKAGHHGSNASSSAPFLAAVRPQVIVISSGAENNFGHPHPDMLARAAATGATILRTDQLGTIEVVTDGTTMWWQSRR